MKKIFLSILLLAGISLTIQAQKVLPCKDSLAIYQQGVENKDGVSAYRLARWYDEGHYVSKNKAMAEQLWCKAVEWGYTPAYFDLCYLYHELDSLDQLEQTAKAAMAAGISKAYYCMGINALRHEDTKKAIAYLKKGIAQNDMTCVRLLSIYYKNQGDYNKAYKLWKSLNTPLGWTNMALMILKGEYTKGDMEEALALLNKAADAGYEDALDLLGYIYSGAIEELANLDVAIGFYQRWADLGNSDGFLRMGHCYRDKGDDARKIECYTKAAAMDNAAAYSQLAASYLDGSGVPCDTALAYDYCLKAADYDNGLGLWGLAYFHLNGMGVPQDEALTLHYMRRAAHHHIGDAAAYMGAWFEEGSHSLEQSADSAKYYYYMGSKEDNPICDYWMGKMLFDDGNYDDAVEFIISAAKHGHLGAYLLYARCLMSGWGLEADPYEAISILTKLSEEEEMPDAYTYLGICRLDGIGCTKDDAEGKRLLDIADNLGSKDAAYGLGFCYRDGRGCEADSAMTVYYWLQAADNGSNRALEYLGDYYAEHNNYKEAAALYQRGADNGDCGCLCELGLCYRDGNGVVLNSQKAFECFQKTADVYYPRGLYLLGVCYLEGTGVEENIEMAEHMLDGASFLGYSQASYLMGTLYESGQFDKDGLPSKKSLQKALDYYNKAAQKGHEGAIEAIQRLSK